MKKLILIQKMLENEHSIGINEEDIDTDYFNDINNIKLSDSTHGKIEMRNKGNFAGKALFLSDTNDYAIGYDSNDIKIFVPLKKK